MGMIGHLYGMEVYINEYCVIKSIEFTRKQTRKFKNHRWVKKYMKKYSYEIFTPTMVQIHDKITMHPTIWEQIKKELEDQKTSPTSPLDMNHKLLGAY